MKIHPLTPEIEAAAAEVRAAQEAASLAAANARAAEKKLTDTCLDAFGWRDKIVVYKFSVGYGRERRNTERRMIVTSVRVLKSGYVEVGGRRVAKDGIPNGYLDTTKPDDIVRVEDKPEK